VSDHRRPILNALVLAAGNGKRLKTGAPKPLHRLLGVPLLARTLFTLERAGVTDAYIVLGYEAERIRSEIERIDRIGIRIHWLYNPEWRQPNGLSVLTAESVLREPFILTMADHLFDPAVVTTLLQRAHGLEGIDLAVDYDIDGVFDLDDATKVHVASERIVAIGKSLPRYQAIDTGVFLASPALFGAMREASAGGKASLSDGVQRLADAGLARVTDIGDLMWQDIDTPEAVAEAERVLLAGVRKSTDGPVARYLNRPVSAALSRQLVKTSITPNQISVATLVIGLLSAGLAATGGYLPFLFSGILFQFASILDGADGEVAKLTFRTSRRGEWIDTVCDQVSYVAFLVGLLVGVHHSALPAFYFRLGVLGLIAASLSMLNISMYLIRQRESGSALAVRYGFQRGTGPLSRILRVVQYFGKRDLMAFLVLLLAMAGQLPLALALFGVGGTFLLLPATTLVNLPSLRRSIGRPQLAPAAPVIQAQQDLA